VTVALFLKGSRIFQMVPFAIVLPVTHLVHE
jgi:hypothetical protein